MSIYVFVLFNLLHLYVFLFQRVTLTIARLTEGVPRNDLQLALTPTWIGILGWVSNIGFYGSLVYLWLDKGLLWAVGGFIISQIVFAIVPMPQNYYYKIIINHLKKEMQNTKEIEKRIVFEALLGKVEGVRKNYVAD